MSLVVGSDQILATQTARASAKVRGPIVLIMGVSGSGKTTIGALLAQALNLPFLDADLLHPSRNIAKMKRGEALNDKDRRGWLNAIKAAVAEWRLQGQGGVLACSALRRRYRQHILGDDRGTHLVYLQAPISVIAERLHQRQGHFMPPSLLESQLATLEEPATEEDAIVIDMRGSPKEAVETILRKGGLSRVADGGTGSAVTSGASQGSILAPGQPLVQVVSQSGLTHDR